MAVSIVGTAAEGANNATTTLTVSHTLSAGSNRVIVGAFAWNNSLVDTISSVTYGGVAMSEVSGSPESGAGGQSVSLWAIKEASLPANGSRDMVVTWGSNADAYGGVIGFQDVDQSSTFGTMAKATATSDSPTVTVTGTSADGFIIGVCAHQFGLISSGDATQWASGANNQRGFGATKDPGVSSVLAWVLTTGVGEWNLAAVELKPAAAAASVRMLATLGVGT